MILRCVGETDLFFERRDFRRINQAIDMCRRCSNRSGCLQGALDRRELHGIWGGVLFRPGQAESTLSVRSRADAAATLSTGQISRYARLSRAVPRPVVNLLQ